MNQEELPKQLLKRLLHVGQVLASVEEDELAQTSQPALPEQDLSDDEELNTAGH